MSWDEGVADAVGVRQCKRWSWEGLFFRRRARPSISSFGGGWGVWDWPQKIAEIAKKVGEQWLAVECGQENGIDSGLEGPKP